MQNRIRELRLSFELTQSELAHKIGLNQSAIGKYERGELEPSIETLKRLSQIFECSIDYVTGNSDDLGVISIQRLEQAALMKEEQELLEAYRALNPNNKSRVFAYAKIRLEEQED